MATKPSTRKPATRSHKTGTRKTKTDNSSLQITPPLIPRPYPELVFGVVGPVGVNLTPIITVLSKVLNAFNYTTKPIRLSKQIEQFFGSDHSKDSEDIRISKLMDEGTRLREDGERGDAVALLGIAEIRRIRKEELHEKCERNAYILRSLKHPHEIQTLRNVYGKGFYLISVYSPRDVRVDALASRISKSQFGQTKSSRSKAEDIIERDEQEEGKNLGQDVKDAFPLADLFIDGRNQSSYEAQITRFLELIFGNVFHTPSRDEHGMYHARSAALRSADMNRQVGAAILRKEGDLIAVGCNDVPKFGGDLYWPGDKGDARDFQSGNEAMTEERVQVLGELLEKFNKNGLLAIKDHENINHLVKELVSGQKKDVLKGTRVMNLLEFGRSVHAEMAALMSAARLGISVKDATLFCTTFPCHMCARHIVASGINRVVYVEPYPKSKAKQLHKDSISVDPSTKTIDSVSFEPFQGIAPRQYLEIFDAGDTRKDEDGKAIDWRSSAKPRLLRFMNTYRDIEEAIVAEEIPLLAKKIGVNLPLMLDSNLVGG